MRTAGKRSLMGAELNDESAEDPGDERYALLTPVCRLSAIGATFFYRLFKDRLDLPRRKLSGVLFMCRRWATSIASSEVCCGLLSRPAAEAQPVRRQPATARDHEGWQWVSATVAGRVRQPCDGPHGKDSALQKWGFSLGAGGGSHARRRAIVAVAR